MFLCKHMMPPRQINNFVSAKSQFLTYYGVKLKTTLTNSVYKVKYEIKIPSWLYFLTSGMS